MAAAAKDVPQDPHAWAMSIASHGHVAAYLAALAAAGRPQPKLVQALDRSMKDLDTIDVLYPVGDPLFVHIHDHDERRAYVAIEPAMNESERALYAAVRDRMLRQAAYEAIPRGGDELRAAINRLIDAVTREGRVSIPFLQKLDGRIPITPEQKSKVLYFATRDIVEHGPIETIIRDPYIEDVSSVGLHNIFVVHKLFDTVETNVKFRDDRELDNFLRTMGERIGRPVSESRPIVDATLPDGSRINIIYSEDVSQRGASFTIRKFSDTPTSITQICKWGTMSTGVAAYLWLCLENGMSVFVCGETASGKTTSLNAILSFIKPKDKVFTAEDTAEVRPPQPLWQQLVTRSAGPVEGRVEMFDLLKAALRSRPNYIIVGEIRGAEGGVAFQAMQTGHPCIATFHASSVGKMIQRFTSDPINVPVAFMDNLNVCLIQMAVYNKGRMLRRVLAVEEIEGYNEQAGGVLTRRVFNWDPVNDAHQFRGRNNSYVLEQKIADKAGYADKRKIYEELDRRKAVLDRMIELKLFDYYEVNRILARYNEEGPSSLPFKVK